MPSAVGTCEEEEQVEKAAHSPSLLAGWGSGHSLADFRGGGVWLTGQCSLAFSATRPRRGQEAVCPHVPRAQESNELALLRL